MKKWLTTLLVGAVTLFCSAVHAVEIGIEPQVTMHYFDDLDNAVGVGAQVNVDELLPANLRVSAGFEMITTERDIRIATLGGMDVNVEPEAVIASGEIGYVYKATDKIDLIPVVGLDYWSITGDDFCSIDNAVGVHFGAKAEYQATDNVALSLGAKVMWAETDVKIGPLARDRDVDLDNVALTGGVNITF